MAGGLPAIPREVTGLSFFFNNFANSDEAANYVIEKNRGPGTFLLRPSTRTPGTLTLTISIDQNTARHVNVQMKPDERSETRITFFIIPERSFSSFHDLYYYYSLNAICNLEMVSNVRLLNPINRSAVPLPIIPPIVMPNEIPDLPKPSSVSSDLGKDDGRRASGPLQWELPKIPPISTKRDRPSLDSQGNDNPASSNSSGSMGKVEPIQCQGAQYLGPDSEEKGSKPSPFPNLPSPGPPLPLTPSKNEWRGVQKKPEKEKKKNKDKEKKKNKDKKKKKEMDEMVQLGWCRPPMPIPQPAQEESPYYTTPRPYRNHLEDLKKMLRESEICDCGLRMVEAELAKGWTVHRSREDCSYKRVFYQHEDGNTTWAFPPNITDQLTDTQVKFIADLCKDAKQDLPETLFGRCQRICPTGPGRGNFGSTSSSRLRSSSSSSSDQFGPSASLSRSPTVVDPRSMHGATGLGH